MKSALIAVYCRRIRVAKLLFLWTAVVCSAGLMGTGCSMHRAAAIPDEIVEPEEASEQPIAPIDPAIPPRRVQLSPKIVPNSNALFFGETESRKTLVLRNLGTGAGEFSFRIPEESFKTGNESVTFTPASGTVPAGKMATVVVDVQRDVDACTRVLRLAILRTAQGSRSIGVNYTNTGRANLAIDKEGTLGRDFEPNSNVIDFGKEARKNVEFTVTNRGCATGMLTILKAGPHEDKLVVPGGPYTVRSGEPTVISLQRPDESFFLGTRSVTLLIRQDDATVDNIVVRWAGLFQP